MLLGENKRPIIGSDKPAYGSQQNADYQAQLWMNTYNNSNPEVKADSWQLIGKPKYKK